MLSVLSNTKYTFLRKKSHEGAGQKQEAADYWYFGSIAQVTLAATDVTLFDRS